MKTPNLRQLYAPDPNYLILECDMERADAAVVIWEAKDEVLKAHVRNRADIHMENAKAIFGPTATKAQRQLAKTACHAVNYHIKARTLALSIGVSQLEAQQFIDKWFLAHPGIRSWHHRIDTELLRTRRIKNIYGYPRTFNGRLTNALSEALGWIGQSTVAINCTKAMLALDKVPDVQILLQVHDSIVFQIPNYRYPDLLPAIHKALHQITPYSDPLTIQWSPKASFRNWGDCLEFSWENPPEYKTLTKVS